MMQEATVALYWDFENIHASLFDAANGKGSYGLSAYKVQEPLVDIAPVMNYVTSIGSVVINRAYANWSRFGTYGTSLLEHSVETIQLFWTGKNAKNGADIRLALDVVRDIQLLPYVSHIVLVAGDSDYISLAQRCRSLGKTVIGVGVQGSVNRFLIKSFNEFKYYSTLLTKTVSQPPMAETHGDGRSPEGEVVKPDGAMLLASAIHSLASASGEDWALKARIRPMITRLDPSFDEANYGFRTFEAFLRAHSALYEVNKAKHDHIFALSARGRALLGLPSDPQAPQRPAGGAEVQEGAPPPGEAGSAEALAAPAAPAASVAPAHDAAALNHDQKLELYKSTLRKAGFKPNALQEYCAILDSICDCLQEQPAPDKAALLDRVVSARAGAGLQTNPDDVRTCINFIFGLKMFLLQKDENGGVTSMGMKKNVTKELLHRKLIRTFNNQVHRQIAVERPILYAALLKEGEADGWMEWIDEALGDVVAGPVPPSA